MTRIEVGRGTRPVRIGDAVDIGGAAITVIAGPCAAEGPEMMRDTARAVRDAGASMLRAGAFKPRTSPHTYQGAGFEALQWIADASRSSGLPVVTEVVDPRHVERMLPTVAMFQVGARNMQNYALLAELGQTRLPVLLKRGLAATLREFLLAAEHIRSRGNEDIVLCERGIRTFESSSRFTLDVTAVPILKSESDLPVVVDPSHAGGRASLVPPLARAAIAAGADGLIVEVHPRPVCSQSDPDQALDFDAFTVLMNEVRRGAAAIDRPVAAPPILPG